MILTCTHDFDTILAEINADVDKYINLSRIELFNLCINKHLAHTLERYDVEIDYRSDFLIKQASKRVLKALLKIQKNKDKEIIQENMEIDPNEKYSE